MSHNIQCKLRKHYSNEKITYRKNKHNSKENKCVGCWKKDNGCHNSSLLEVTCIETESTVYALIVYSQ